MSPELWAELWISVKSMRSKFVLPVLKKETKKTPTLICGWKNFNAVSCSTLFLQKAKVKVSERHANMLTYKNAKTANKINTSTAPNKCSPCCKNKTKKHSCPTTFLSFYDVKWLKILKK